MGPFRWELEWVARGRVPSAQKAFEMGEESVNWRHYGVRSDVSQVSFDLSGFLSSILLDSSAVLYGWSWETIAPTVANRQWSVHVGYRRSYVYPQWCLRGGLGCRVDDVGCVNCECVCEVESDPKSRGYMGDTTGKQFPMGWSSDQFNWGCNMIRSC